LRKGKERTGKASIRTQMVVLSSIPFNILKVFQDLTRNRRVMSESVFHVELEEPLWFERWDLGNLKVSQMKRKRRGRGEPFMILKRRIFLTHTKTLIETNF
jgi:hypothetical protein